MRMTTRGQKVEAALRLRSGRTLDRGGVSCQGRWYSRCLRSGGKGKAVVHCRPAGAQQKGTSLQLAAQPVVLSAEAANRAAVPADVAGRRFVCFALYFCGKRDGSSKPSSKELAYAVGLVLSLHRTHALLPGWTPVAHLADDVLPRLRHHCEALHNVLQRAIVTTGAVVLQFRRGKGSDGAGPMQHLHHRWDAVRLLGAAEAVAVRDADAPPTPADAAALNAWLRDSALPVLSYRLPLWSCDRCGGGLAFRRPDRHMPQLATHHRRAREFRASYLARRNGDAHGVDEYFADTFLPPHEGWVYLDAFFHPETSQYFADPDYHHLLVDHLDDYEDVMQLVQLLSGDGTTLLRRLYGDGVDDRHVAAVCHMDRVFLLRGGGAAPVRHVGLARLSDRRVGETYRAAACHKEVLQLRS